MKTDRLSTRTFDTRVERANSFVNNLVEFSESRKRYHENVI
jgi:hypothetical protein